MSSILSYEQSILQSFLPFLQTVWSPISIKLMTMPMIPERSKILIEINNKLIPLTYDHTQCLNYALTALKDVSFNYELVK
jgi:hypothetical protein